MRDIGNKFNDLSSDTLGQRGAQHVVYTCRMRPSSHVCPAAFCVVVHLYRDADKSLARPGRKQARKHVRDARDFNNIETRAVVRFFFFLQGKAPKEIHAIQTETIACFLPGRAKDLSAPLYVNDTAKRDYCNM